VDTFLHVVVSNAVVAAGLAVLALAVGLTLRRPALTHALWLLVLLKLLTPPLYPIHLSWLTPPDSTPAASAALRIEERAATEANEEMPAVAGTLAEAEEEPPRVALALVPHEEEEEPATAASSPQSPTQGSWLPALLVVWLVGTLVWFALAVVRVVSFRRLLRHARPASPALQNQVKRLARRLGLIRCPEMLVVPGRIAPMLWAWGGAPCLVVPEGLLAQVSGAQRATLLAHELAHLRRGDHWVRFLEFLAMGLCWWHPAVWLARREVREAEEQCCDAWVVWALPGAGRDYATALVETLDFLAEPAPAAPLLASGIGPVTDLKRRLTMIMRGTTPRSLTWGGVLTVLCLAAMLLPVLPTWAQKPKEAEEEEQVRTFRFAFVDGDDADLQKAQAELKRLEAEIKASQEKMRKAAEQIRKAMVEKERARASAEREKARAVAEEARAKARVVRGKGEDTKDGGVIRIEVIVSKDAKAVDVKKLTEELQRVLQGVGGKININVEDGQPGQRRMRVIENKIESGDAKGRIIIKPEVEVRVTPEPKKPGEKKPDTKKPEPKKPGADAAPKGKPDDGRLEKLEKRLDELIRELDQMRRELRRPSRGGASGTPPVPGAPTAPVVGLVPPTPATPPAGLPPTAIPVPVAPPGAAPTPLPAATPALPPGAPPVGR
jgi:beta-lactamase regulating signal transducer with metallopeptidase domain